VGDHVIATLEKVTKQKITATFNEKIKGSGLNENERQIDKIWQTIEEEA